MFTKQPLLSSFEVSGTPYHFYDSKWLASEYAIDELPFSIRLLLENLLRHSKTDFVTEQDIRAVAGWQAKATPKEEIAFVPARVVLQDFTGVPAIVDLATMRDAVQRLGGDPHTINPLSPVELVIDHSVMVDHFGDDSALEKNTSLEVKRNRERYEFLKWGQQSFNNLKVVPPGTGIVHQVNLEYLARGAFIDDENLVYPDTLVGTDSHTTMINGLGVLGWGVGGIEAEAAMLGQPISMLLPQVVGFELTGQLKPGTTATDLVLTVTEQLRAHGVVGKFVEFYGSGLKHLSVADRATIANMAPEYGATCGLFHMDSQTMDYLRFTGRSQHQVDVLEAYLKASGLWQDPEAPNQAKYSSELTLNLAEVQPCIAGPKRPQDRIVLQQAKQAFESSLANVIRARNIEETEGFEDEGGNTAVGQSPGKGGVSVTRANSEFLLEDGDVVIAAITSCTNTSNPSVLVTAGLLARNAIRKGLKTPEWVKTSLAPGSKVVTEYLEQAGLMDDLEALGFYLVGYGCTTCIGNSGPLPADIESAIVEGDLVVGSVLSGNRNFEGRIHARVRNNYLASPPLVVAYALAGSLKVDLTKDPIGTDEAGDAVYLSDIWPSAEEVQTLIDSSLTTDMFQQKYANVYEGPDSWKALSVDGEQLYNWPDSYYIRQAPFFDAMSETPEDLAEIRDARCLVKVGDSITTDHISPAGAIDIHSPASIYLQENGVAPEDFNSYGSRRGNHEIMMRGTFANVRLKNQLAPGPEGSFTTCFIDDEVVSIFEAAERYKRDKIPLVVIAGKEYGTGSSRDWAAKGPALLGVKVVMAQSYERIHRSNLVGMGILPLQFEQGESAETLGLSGRERFSFHAVEKDQKMLRVNATTVDGASSNFRMVVRIDTPNEFEYYRHGGILQFVIRRLLS